MISGSLFALDYYYLPETNRRQDAIRDEIKGRPVRTFVNPDRRWTFGKKERIFYHSFFDSEEQVLATANVFDFESERFRLKRQISAERARWDQQHCAWVFENGWVREFDGNRPTSFETFEARAFPDLDEEPSYFLKEERQHQQMNWRELRAYISDLTQSGFDTVRLRVQLHKKLAFPLFAISMAVLAIPFSLVAGHRGALTGVALSIGLAITYYAINALIRTVRTSQPIDAGDCRLGSQRYFRIGGDVSLSPSPLVDPLCPHDNRASSRSPRKIEALPADDPAGLFRSAQPSHRQSRLAQTRVAAADGRVQSQTGAEWHAVPSRQGSQGRCRRIILRELRPGRGLRRPRARCERAGRDDEEILAIQDRGHEKAGRRGRTLRKHFQRPLGHDFSPRARVGPSAAASL